MKHTFYFERTPEAQRIIARVDQVKRDNPNAPGWYLQFFLIPKALGIPRWKMVWSSLIVFLLDRGILPSKKRPPEND